MLPALIQIDVQNAIDHPKWRTHGFETYLIEDACFTFGNPRWPAEEIHAMSLTNLDGEYCQIIKALRRHWAW